MGRPDRRAQPHFSWNRERRWIRWSIILIGATAMIAFSAARLSAQGESTESPTSSSTISNTGGESFLFLVGLILFLVATVFLVRGLHWRFVGWRNIQNARMLREAEFARAWDLAARLSHELSAGQQLPLVDPGSVLPRANEVFHIRTEVGYSRLIALGDGSYDHFVAAGTGPAGIGLLAGSLIGNSRRRSAAMAAATPAWREHQQTHLLAGNYGIIAFPYGRTMHFDWERVTAFHPDPNTWSVAFEFEAAEPLTLYGPYAPLIAVYAASRLWDSQRFRTSPALRPFIPTHTGIRTRAEATPSSATE